jgi:predicted 2-oxoglutarate/Fe(II)-dependent dioxygenase YbiX
VTLETNSEIFLKNQYIHCPKLITLEIANEVAQGIQKLIDEGDSFQDHMCPLSHSVVHKPILDSLLEQLTPHISEITGKKLYPTYAFARKYAPGDELKIHTDRPACEISATINLGFKGEQWPIYVGHKKDKSESRKIDMNIGDGVIYKGCEVLHWREKYTEGEWQFQVFVHYVDAEGPNKEWKYDKREKLAHHNSQEYIYKGVYTHIPKAFSSESCDKIIKQCEKQNLEEAAVGSYPALKINKTIRDTKRIVLPNDIGIGATLTGIGFQANAYKWKFDVTKSNQTEFLKYDKNGHFSSHVDTFLESFDNKETRKISVILILSDGHEGGKFYLKIQEEKIYPKQDKGDIIIFPSFLLHGVEPITSGIRRSMITWLVGPYFK